MQQAENVLHVIKPNSEQDRNVRRLLVEISRCQGRNINDVSRAGVMLNPSSVREWTNLSLGGDAPAQMALKLAQRDYTMDMDELSQTYEKSGSLGDIQSGILLSPWRTEGWRKLSHRH
jgi:hypothetical protein